MSSITRYLGVNKQRNYSKIKSKVHATLTIYLTLIMITATLVILPIGHADEPLLFDSTFSTSQDSDDLRENTIELQDWYESRNDNPLLLTLDTNDIQGNTGKKAALKGSFSPTTAYLTQELSISQTSHFNLSFDLNIHAITPYGKYNRTAFLYLGDDADAMNGPCSTSIERFVILAIHDPDPTTTANDLELRAREFRHDNLTNPQPWNDTSTWTVIATDLSYQQWYTITLDINVPSKTYDVFLDGTLVGDNILAYEDYMDPAISYISFSTGGTARGDFYVDNVFIPAVERPSLQVTIIGDGTVEKNPGESTYVPGTEVLLTATPDLGWSFTQWTGDITSSENPLSITITTDISLTAHFTKTGYLLTLDIRGNGSVTKTPDEPTYDLGETVLLEATAGSDHVFSEWSGDLTGSTNPTVITMTTDMAVTATFLPLSPLLDGEFTSNIDSDDLRNNASFQDWYESRQNDTSVLRLDQTDIEGNTGKKAALEGFETRGYAYLTQEFSTPQDGIFTISLDVLIDRIEDYGTYDRAGYIYLGDNSRNDTSSDTGKGPCSTSNERFVFLTFYDNGGSGTNLQLMAREYRHDNATTPQPWADTSTWTSVSSALRYDTWHTITLEVNVPLRTYDVYIDGTLQRANIHGYEGYQSLTLTHLSFSAGGTGRGDIYIDNIMMPSATRYRLQTDSVGGGYVDVYPGEATYSPGTEVQLNAVPLQGWSFDYWTGDLTGTDNPATLTINDDVNITARFSTGNVNPTVETNNVTDINETSAKLWGNLIDDGGETCSVWFEWDAEQEITECMGTIATGSVCKDNRSILHKNRHYKKNNQRPRFFQGPKYAYFGIGNDDEPYMCRMGQNEKGLAIANADVYSTHTINVNHLVPNTSVHTSDRTSLEDNDMHYCLGNFDTVADAAYWIAAHSKYHGNYWIISAEQGVGAVVCVDKTGRSTVTWINNSYAAVSNVFFCNGGHDLDWGPNDVTAEQIMRDIVENGTSSDGDHFLNWQDIAQRVAKDTRDKEDGDGAFYVGSYGGEISNGASRASIVCVAGNESFNETIHMTWLAFGKTTQLSIFLPLYAGGLRSPDDIPVEFGNDSGTNLGIQPYVDVKEAYANEGLSTDWYYCDRVREIQKYAFYNENITFSGFDDTLDTITGATDEHAVRSLLSSFVNETLPVALDGYIHNISTSASFTDKQYPQTIGYFSEVLNGLQPGTMYSVIAHANNSVFASSGNPVLFLTRPACPVNVNLQVIDGTSVRLSWDIGDGSQKTIVERHVTPSWSRGEGIEIYNDTGTNTKDSGLLPGATYYYQFWSFTSVMDLQQYSSKYAIKMVTLPGELLLLHDGSFSETVDTLDLITKTDDFDWYESRNDNPAILTLNTSSLGGNIGKKASFHNYHLPNNAYLTQQFSVPQYRNVTVSFDIYIDRINDSTTFDRTGNIYLGDNREPGDGPTGTSSERFVMMAFYDPTPGTTGNDLQLRARTSSTQTYADTSEWTLITSGLSYDTWYTLDLTLDVFNGTYDVSINGQLLQSHLSKYSGYTSSSVSYISFAADSEGRGDFLVDNIFCPNVNRVSTYSIPLLEGWNLIGLPCSDIIQKNAIQVRNNSILYSWDDAVQENIILNFIYNYNGTTQAYEITDVLMPGCGYWAWAQYPCDLVVMTDAVGSSIITEVLSEWNLISIPYQYSIAKQDTSILNENGEESWAEAVSNSHVINFMYGWNPVTQNYESIETLQPGNGYWLCSYMPQLLRE